MLRHAATVDTVDTPSIASRSVASLAAEFTDARGYLAACTVGLVGGGTRRAVRAALDGRPDVAAYSAAVEGCREAFARLVDVAVDRVAIGSQTSVQLSLLAAALPDGATVLVPEGEFSSVVLPFVHAGRGIRVRTAPLGVLADAVTSADALVAFSLVQSATGEVADGAAIAAAAARVGARTVCDVTQAAGWMPVDASMFDAVVCHAYKWLCAPRGVAFLALRDDYARTLRPVQAGWYAGDDPWSSCYGGDALLAECARRFDVSPAWQAFVGAEPMMRAFADADRTGVHRHTTGLAAEFRTRIDRACGTPGAPSAIVTWADPDGRDLDALAAAGITASGRRGRAHIAFHVFNDHADVDLAVAALRR